MQQNHTIIMTDIPFHARFSCSSPSCFCPPQSGFPQSAEQTRIAADDDVVEAVDSYAVDDDVVEDDVADDDAVDDDAVDDDAVDEDALEDDVAFDAADDVAVSTAVAGADVDDDGGDDSTCFWI